LGVENVVEEVEQVKMELEVEDEVERRK